MSFRDKYKGKSETVQRDGSNAMLVSNDGKQPAGGNSRRPSKTSNPTASNSSVPQSQQQQAPVQQQQQLPPLAQQNTAVYQQPPPLNPYAMQQNPYANPYAQQQAPLVHQQAPRQQLAANQSPQLVQRAEHHGGGTDGQSGLSTLVSPQGAIGRENPYARRDRGRPQQPTHTTPQHDQQQQLHQSQQQVNNNSFQQQSPQQNNQQHHNAHHHQQHQQQQLHNSNKGQPFRTVSPSSKNLNMSAQHNISMLADNAVYDDSPTRRAAKKPPLPDFSYQPPVVQHGRRAGQAPHEIPPMLGNYKPHTLGEYKKLQEDTANRRWGGLGAEDNDEKQAAREKRAKIFNYARSVNAVNFAMMDMTGERAGVPKGRGLCEVDSIGKAKRDRALKYGMENGFSPKRARMKSKTPDPSIDTTLDQQLNELEEKQRRDHQRIAEIKKALGLVSAEDQFDYDN